MDNNNWVPAPGQGAEPPLETGEDWRTQLSPEARQRVVHKLMEMLRKHVPFLDHDQAGLEQVKKLAMRCEEKIYNTAVDQPEYMRKICIKMLTMESKSQNTNSNPLPSNSPGNCNAVPDSGASHNMQPQVPNSAQLLSLPMSTNQSQGHQEIMSSQNTPNNIGSVGIQSSASLASALPPVSGLSQTSIPSVVGQNPTMQNTSGVPQNPAGSSLGQGVPSNNMFANSQRQIQGRQQVLHQQQEQPQSPQQYLYPQQLLKQKFQQQGNLQHTIVPSNLQPQQQNLIHSTSQQSGLQPSMIRSSDLSGMQQNQASTAQQSTVSILQHPQSVLRQQHQAASFRQQQHPMMHQSLLPSQKHIMVQQPNATNMQKNQLTGQQQRLLSQQINLQNLQQHQQPLMAQKNNFSSMHQQQLGSQGNVSALQQHQQRLGTQSGNSTMQSNQHSLHMMQNPKVPMQQQTLQNVANMLPSQGQQSQQQLSQQQLKSRIQSQPTHMQRQLVLQQPNPLQLDMKPGLQASTHPPGALLQQQNVIDQQRQLYQSQRPIPETSSTSLESTAQTGQSNADDWREEVHQKIKAMKEMYLPELNELYQKIASKLQQHDSLPQQLKSEQPEKLKMFKNVLEHMMFFLHVSKDNIKPSFKEKVAPYEKQIMSFINSNRVRKPILARQQGLGQTHIQKPQSQASQVQSHDNQMQGSVQNLQQKSMGTMQNTSLSSVSGVSTPQQNIMNSVQINSTLDSGQGKAIGSLQQTVFGPLQQVNATNFSSQSGVNMIQSNLHMHQQELHSQQLKQCQMNQQSMKQQMMQQQQQLHPQTKQHSPAQMQAHQMSLANHNDVNELKVKHFQQHNSGGQLTTYSHQQMKPRAPFSISSPQLLQTGSPQLSQHSSPQIDQQNLQPSLTKAGTPLQSGNSPFMIPSPSTPLAPSPMPGDSGKPTSGVSPLSKAAGNIGQQQVIATHPSAPSLAIGTPGISPSPLLAELTASDGGGNVNDVGNISSGESNVAEKPLDRLIKAVKSISSEALSTAVSDISSVVSMMDSIAGSAPDNTSRAAVGDNLVAMTNCRLQARKFITRDGITATRKMKRDIVSSAGSVSDIVNISGQDIPDLESTATSRFKRPRIEPNRALLEEISEINCQLVDTVVDVCEKDNNPTTVPEGGEGTIVKCSYIAAALSPNLKSQYASGKMSPIQPIRLLVPTNYPSCSPELLDKSPVEFSEEHEDLSVKARSRFERSLRCLHEPMSLEEIARTWDVCARAVVAEYAQQSGGGTFSTKYGTWVDCSIAT